MGYAIRNDAGIDTALIERVLQASVLPVGRLLVLLSRKGAPSFDGGGPYLGMAIADRFRKYSPRTAGILPINIDWDFAVALFREALEHRHQHPEYLAFHLAHELEHVRVAAEEPESLVLSDLIHWQIRDASGGQVSAHQETPAEVQADKAGKAAAISLFGEDSLQASLTRLRDEADTATISRFDYLIGLDPTPATTSLAERLRHFAAPYRSELERLWHAAARDYPDSMLELVVDIDTLLDLD